MSLQFLLLAATVLATSAADVRKGAAFIEGIATGACPNLRGYFNVETNVNTGATTFTARFPNIDTACSNPGAPQAIKIAVYPISETYTADESTRFGSPTQAHDVYLPANSLSHPYTVLKTGVNGDVPSTIDLMKSSEKSMLGRSVVISIGGNYVGSGVIGRSSAVAPSDTNTAGSSILFGQTPTLVCKFSNAGTLDATTTATRRGTIVISSLANSGGVVVGAVLGTGFDATSHHRISLYQHVHVPQNDDMKSTPADAADALGSVLVAAGGAAGGAAISTSFNLPCSDSARLGDLGNSRGTRYYSRLRLKGSTQLNDLVGSSCSVWTKPMRTCDAWSVGCTTYESDDVLLATGVVGISDESAREAELGSAGASLNPPSSGGVDYDCLGATSIVATAHLYPTDVGASKVEGGGSFAGSPIAIVTMVQSSGTKSVALSMRLLSAAPSWLTSPDDSSPLRALSIQTTGDLTYADSSSNNWDLGSSLSSSTTFHPNKDHRRALPPNALRRAGDIGSLDLGTGSRTIPASFEYYIDASFGENLLTLAGTSSSSVVGRTFALHAKPDTGLGEDSNRGLILAHGVIGTPTLSPGTQVNLARGSQLDREELVCVLRNVAASSSDGSKRPHGVFTLSLTTNLEKKKIVTVAAEFQEIAGDGKETGGELLLEMYDHGDTTGSFVGRPMGPAPTEDTPCYSLPSFGYIGSVTNSILYSKMSPPRDGTLSSLVGKSCVLNEMVSDVRRPVAIGVFALVGATSKPLHLRDTTKFTEDKMIDCFEAPIGVVKIPGNKTVNQGELVESKVALIIGCAVGIPLGLCVCIAAIWSFVHYRQTHATIRKTVRLKNAVRGYDLFFWSSFALLLFCSFALFL